MLTKTDENNIKVGETQTYGNPKKGGLTIRWPYQVKHGDEYNKVQDPFPGFDEWLESQSRACQAEIEQRRQDHWGSCSASQFASLKRQLEGVDSQSAPGTPGASGKRRSTQNTSGGSPPKQGKDDAWDPYTLVGGPTPAQQQLFLAME